MHSEIPREVNEWFSLVVDMEIEIITNRLEPMPKIETSRPTPLLRAGRDLSMQQLAKVSALLDGQQSRTANIQKEIQNEISLARKNDGAIGKHISRVTQEGELLASRYEQQRNKCTKLEALVRTVEEELYREKAEQAEDTRNKVQTDKLAEHSGILADREKTLEKVLEKSNTASYDLSKKLDTIRALRSERTIVSALFDKIERQLCSLEHCYKVLVIERKREEELLQRSVEDFNLTHSNGQRQLSKLALRNEEARQKRLEESKSWQQESRAIKVDCLMAEERRGSVVEDRNKYQLSVMREHPGHQHSSSDLLREKDKIRERTLKLEQDMAKVRHEKCVKTIFNDLGVSHTKQLPQNLYNLQEKNEELLKSAEGLFLQISKVEQDIRELGRQPRVKTGPTDRKIRLSLKQTSLQSCASQIARNRRELQEFRSVCRVVLERARETQQLSDTLPSDFLNEQEEIVFYMGELQKFFEHSYRELPLAERKATQQGEPKALGNLLNAARDHQNMSIYEEQDLLDFARKNLEKAQRS